MHKNLIEMFKESGGKGAAGAFNLHYFGMLPAVITATQELGAPIVIQTSLEITEYIGFEILIAAVKALAKKADINVCLHMNYCKSMEVSRKAIDPGYSSIMHGGSNLPLEGNIKDTREVTACAHERSVSMGRGVGSVGGAEDGIIVERNDVTYTKPMDTIRFAKETNVDALAVTIEITHGQYKSKVDINYKPLETLQDRLSDVGLMLHGGTDVNDEDVKRYAKGMKKINVGTELGRSYAEEVNASFPDAALLALLRKLFTPTNDHTRRIITRKSTLPEIQLNVHGTVDICITEPDNT